MKRALAVAIFLAASFTAGHALEAATLQAPADIVALLKKRFPTIVEDNVWMGLGGGFKCRDCSLIWFEDSETNWACNFTFANGMVTAASVTIKNCWKRPRLNG